MATTATLKKITKDISKLEAKKAGLEEKKQALVSQINDIDKEIQSLKAQEAALKIKNVEKAALKNGKTVDEVLDFLSENLTDVLELMGDSKAEDVSQETSDEQQLSEEETEEQQDNEEPQDDEDTELSDEGDEDTEDTEDENDNSEEPPVVSSVWDR